MSRYLLSSTVVCFLRFSLLLSIKTVVQSLELNDQKAIGGLAGEQENRWNLVLHRTAQNQ
ncbi:MAG: hypothetical protein BGO21_20325 [Dyadobacter sp. 50-39]|nr:MAG: hypothetical protein BGO21_20325 [Dyadobacter sp. 50-39]